MSEGLVLIWFFSPSCSYCLDLDDEVAAFATSQGAQLVKTTVPILDLETREPQVPALMYNHPKTGNHLYVGRFCLDALRYNLENG